MATATFGRFFIDLFATIFRIAHGLKQGKSLFLQSERSAIFSLTYEEKDGINFMDSIRGGTG
jgi:hypothetical protein